MKAWIIQDGPYWHGRAETLRRSADETDMFRPETRARMLRIAKDYDVLAKRADQHGPASQPAPTDRTGEPSRTLRRRVTGPSSKRCD